MSTKSDPSAAAARITMLPMKGIPDAELALELVMDALKRRAADAQAPVAIDQQ
jgi:hypothetical protein